MKNQSQSSSIKEEHQCFKAKLKQRRNFPFRKTGLENAKKNLNQPPHYFSQTIVYNLISSIALSNFNNGQHSVFTFPLIENCLSLVYFSFIRFQIAMCFTFNKERIKKVLFLWWHKIM